MNKLSPYQQYILSRMRTHLIVLDNSGATYFRADLSAVNRRTMQNLARRGLVETVRARMGYAFSLTAKGREVAQMLEMQRQRES